VTYSTTGTTVDSADVTFSGGAVGDECDGLSAEVTLSGTNSLSAAATATVANAVASADFSSANVNAEDVTDVSVVISG
jgi:hypothetical protein